MSSHDSLILRAASYAFEAHRGQKRNFTSAPFITHPCRVAGRLATLPNVTPEMVAAAYLHDVVEDTDIGNDQLRAEFGAIVAELVEELTEPSTFMTGDRATRKAADLEHIREASEQAKLIRLVDRIDNLQDMRGAPAKYVQRFARESRELLLVIGEVSQELRSEADRLIEDILS